MTSAWIKPARACAALASLALLAGCVSDERIGGPHGWAPLTPGAEFTPAAASAAGQEGWVILSCAMTEGRRIKDCEVVQEYPKNWGYGEAALRLREGIVIAEDETAAIPAGEKLRLPVLFCIPGKGPCTREAVRARHVAHRSRLGATFPGEEPIPE